MTPTCIFPKKPLFNPLRLASNYRDYFGDPNALLTELTDSIIESGCYVPRIFHAPDTTVLSAPGQGLHYLEYALAIPPGSFIIAYMHAFTAVQSDNLTDPPVKSGFRVQITDIAPEYKFFGKPVPEAFFLNDIPSANPQGVLSTTSLYVQNQTPRLLPTPYPVTYPGIFKVEFWTIAPTSLKRLSFLCAIPDPDMKGLT